MKNIKSCAVNDISKQELVYYSNKDERLFLLINRLFIVLDKKNITQRL